MVPLLSTCINGEGQSWHLKQQREMLKWQKLVFPACVPEYRTMRSVWLPEEWLRDSTALLPALWLGQERKPEHARVFPMTIIFCITAITTAILLTSSCPKRIGWAGPAYCQMAKIFTLCTALFLFPTSLPCLNGLGFGHELPATPTRLDQRVVNRPNCYFRPNV